MKGLVAILILGLLLAGAILHPHSLSAAALRSDLQLKDDFLCQGRGGEALSKELQVRGIYDAQIEVALAKNVKDAKAFAEDFAQDNGHRAYGFGTCPGGEQWMISTPAPGPVVKRIREGSWQLDEKILKSTCASYDVDVIQKGVREPISYLRRQKPGNEKIERNFGEKGFVSMALTCHPYDRKQKGPELWALIQHDPDPVPNLNSIADFVAWIGAMRQESKLSALVKADVRSDLQTLADLSARQGDLHHPRPLLLQAKAALQLKKVKLIGENRASSPSFQGLAELLWNSPQHRSLILNPEANQLAVSLSEKSSEKLLVMVLAKQ